MNIYWQICCKTACPSEGGDCFQSLQHSRA